MVDETRNRAPIWLRLALVLVIAAGLVLAYIHRHAIEAAAIGERIDDFGFLMPAVYLAAHVVASLLFVPRTVMAGVAGILFGLWWGALLSIAGAVAGSAAGFCLARYINAGLVAPADLARLGPLVRRLEDGGWRAVALVRLVPVMPHALTNYALGLTRLSLSAYLTGSLAGMLPLTFVYVEFGVAGRQAVAGAAAWGWSALWAVVLLALAWAIPRLLGRQAPR
ncbi:MAG: TVP38/TMEM64 family protein [Pseudomonadota bacterium]